MTVNEFLANALKGNLDMFKMTLADMSDADLMTRPVPGANHGTWQLGHLVVAEVGLMTACGAPMPELPAGFKERYGKGSHTSDKASDFATKADALALLEKVRDATIAYAKSVPAAHLAEKGPMPFTPTVADCISVQMVHLGMHMGQIQVIRRKLGKPILF